MVPLKAQSRMASHSSLFSPPGPATNMVAHLTVRLTAVTFFELSSTNSSLSFVSSSGPIIRLVIVSDFGTANPNSFPKIKPSIAMPSSSVARRHQYNARQHE